MTLATAAAVAVVLGATTAAALRPPTALRAVWSNELAVRDYQNLLAGKVEARLEDGPGIVLCQPGDPLADAWAKLAPGAADAVLPFGSEIPETVEAVDGSGAVESFPIYVCVAHTAAAEALEPVLAAVRDGKREDLVFLQRGDMIEPLLKRYGCGRERQTQALLYLGCNEFGKLEEDRVGMGEDVQGMAKFAAESCVTGKWAGAVADRLRRSKFHCAEQFHRDWRRNMIECVVFESVYNLVGALHKSVPVSEVGTYFGDEADDMLYEIQRALRGHLAVTLLAGCESRMAAYAATQARSKQDNRLARVARASPTRNGFFYDLSTTALARDFPDPCPMHTEYWEYGLEKGLFE